MKKIYDNAVKMGLKYFVKNMTFWPFFFFSELLNLRALIQVFYVLKKEFCWARDNRGIVGIKGREDKF